MTMSSHGTACQLSLRVPLHGQNLRRENKAEGCWGVFAGAVPLLCGWRFKDPRVETEQEKGQKAEEQAGSRQEARCPPPSRCFLVTGCEMGWGADPGISSCTEGTARHTRLGRSSWSRALLGPMAGTNSTPVLPKAHSGPRRDRRLRGTAHRSGAVLEEILARKWSGIKLCANSVTLSAAT